MRNLYFRDGTHMLVDDGANGDYALTQLIEEKLGRDAEQFCKDVLHDRKEELESDAYDYIDRKTSLLQSRIDAILFHWKDYLKAPDALEDSLKSLRGELKEMVYEWHFTEN